MARIKITLCSPSALLALGACAKDNQFDETGGVRITRSACPAVAVPAYTGDITLFDPPASRAANAIDVVATITNLRGNCAGSEGAQIATQATFEVQARRTKTAGARDVTMPYFATVVRGGSIVVSKEVGRAALHFADGAGARLDHRHAPPPASTAPPRRCRPRSKSRSPASASRPTPTPRSIRWPIRRSAPPSPRPASRC